MLNVSKKDLLVRTGVRWTISKKLNTLESLDNTYNSCNVFWEWWLIQYKSVYIFIQSSEEKPSEMEVALHYTLFSLFSVHTVSSK